ncbi:MAG: prephenate dehydratase [Lachnospirales bacterium]
MIGYLGPQGTFSQIAAEYYGTLCNELTYYYKTIPSVVNALIDDKISSAVLPIENTTEGSVNATVDSLIYIDNIFIESYLILPIHHNLLVKNNSLKIEKIYSHGQALAQCSKFLFKNYPNAELIETTSTAEAARFISTSDANIAAISPISSASVYNLNILHKDIEDEKENLTNFVKISKKEKACTITTQTICFTTKNKSGELYRILDIFSLWDINMTRIFSRPKKGNIGEYVFYVDLEYSNKNDMESALKMVIRKTSFFKNIGRYDIRRYK